MFVISVIQYALPLADDTQTTMEMHIHGDAVWHFDHNKHPACYVCCEHHAKKTAYACAIQLSSARNFCNIPDYIDGMVMDKFSGST